MLEGFIVNFLLWLLSILGGSLIMVVFYVGLFVVLMIIFGVFFVIFVNRMLGWGVDVSFFFVVGVMIVVSFISLIFLVIELMGIFILVGVGILFGVIFIYFID